MASFPKPEPLARKRGRDRRVYADFVAKVRTFVFGRERGVCRCCRSRPAESMHELRPRSLGGKVSKYNSVAVCGSGTTGCHGYLQTYQIGYAFEQRPIDAQGTIIFTPGTHSAADWMKLPHGESISSAPMSTYEVSE